MNICNLYIDIRSYKIPLDFVLVKSVRMAIIKYAIGNFRSHR